MPGMQSDSPKPMTSIEQLLTLSRLYAEAQGIKLSTLSSRMFNDGKRLDAIEAGRPIQVTTFERAMQWLSDNWPEDPAWPAGITRPRPTAPTPEQRASA
jgi:hypothetical protein